MDTENRFVIFSENGLKLVVQIMLEHPLQVGLLQHAVRVLGNLSLGNDINKLLIAHEKGVRAVVVVLLGGILCALFSVEDQHTKLDGVLTTFAFFLGAILSASAGWLGMMVATDGNTRTTAACAGKEVKDSQGKVTGGTGSLNDGLRVAFKAGSVMGFVVVGLGLVGCAGCFCILAMHQGLGKTESLQILAGFGFGASSIALFARAAGGIYTKAADVGADLVGKVEAGIDEDDPHNPAVIADNVGDNVGDVAGMGGDLFGSFAEATCAAMIIAGASGKLGQTTNADAINVNFGAMMYPLILSS